MPCSLHTHSLFCDGACSLEEMARAGVEAGLSSLGFSGHAPAPYDHAAMRPQDAGRYLAEIARLNADGSLFDARSGWYRQAEEALAEAAAQSGCIVEVNTSGLRTARREPYPSERILSLLRQADVPVVITADAHRPCDVAAGFDEAAALLRRLGFRSAMTLRRGRFVPETL